MFPSPFTQRRQRIRRGDIVDDIVVLITDAELDPAGNSSPDQDQKQGDVDRGLKVPPHTIRTAEELAGPVRDWAGYPNAENEIEDDGDSEGQAKLLTDDERVAFVSSSDSWESKTAMASVPVARIVDLPPAKKTVTFSRFRFPIYRGEIGSIDKIGELLSQLETPQKMLLKGSYLITITGTMGFNENPLAPMETDEAIDFKIEGKRQRIDKMLVDPANGIVQMQITIIDNPIPLLVLVGGALAASGFAAMALTDTLVQVDKILDRTIVLSVIGLAGFGLYLWKFK